MTARFPMSIRRAICICTSGLLIGGCASGAPTGEVRPVDAHEEERPLEWFAENWGPFDASLNARTADGRVPPLLLIDGRQVRNAVGGRDADVADAFRDLDPTDVVRVEVVRCGAGVFGEPGDHGVIMMFTTAYDGPLPTDHDMPRGPKACTGAG